jgi:uracil-DNA glycosylase
MDERKIIEVISTVQRRIVKGEGYSENGDAWLHPEVDEEADFDRKAREIVDLLVAKRDFPNVGNFYAESDIKRSNLVKYFNALFWLKPEWMLIGEAPGIHGCVKTGIPFTSERLIREGHLEQHFPTTRFVVEGNKAEASATVVWGSVSRLSMPPVMWNAFPLHPQDGNGGNRTPSTAELEWGREALQTVLSLFPGVQIVTVGRKAEAACRRLCVKSVGHLNHPSRQANIFREQFDTLIPLTIVQTDT